MRTIAGLLSIITLVGAIASWMRIRSEDSRRARATLAIALACAAFALRMLGDWPVRAALLLDSLGAIAAISGIGLLASTHRE